MTGSNRFSVDTSSEDFERSLKKLKKATAKRDVKMLTEKLIEILEGLTTDQRPQSSRLEPIPKKIDLPPLCEFRKIEFSIARGASGQIRLMYLADFENQSIAALWIYSHKQFSQRPSDKDIGSVIKNSFQD